jgi:hypothetical protein
MSYRIEWIWPLAPIGALPLLIIPWVGAVLAVLVVLIVAAAPVRVGTRDQWARPGCSRARTPIRIARLKRDQALSNLVRGEMRHVRGART